MRTPLAPMTLAVLLSLIGVSSADVYKCTDRAGRVHYQNMSCTGEDTPAIVSPGPGSTYTGPVRALSAASDLPPRAYAESESIRTASGGPVDTRTFGMLEIGSSEAEVLAKLGHPDRVLEDAKTFVPVRRTGGGVEWREKVRSAWVYDSDGYTLRTLLFFEDGRLVSKEKQGR
jgi:Domain of unknown function (DUF4124)